jgi:secreted Zn-dependent insulinase-like peptidase
VFTGSKKYPDETGWDDFKQQYLGGSNAFTADEETVRENISWVYY